MADRTKVLAQATGLAVTESILYTVGVGTDTTVSSIFVCNRGNGQTTFRVSVSVNSAATANADYLYFDVPIPGNDTFVATVGMTLRNNDQVKIYAGNTSLSFALFGVEVV